MISKTTKIATLIALCIFGHSVFAQRDLIITQAGEEIRCKIIDETPTRFIYKYIGKNNKILMNEIFKNLVVSFKYNQFSSHIGKGNEFKDSENKNSSLNSDPTRIDTRRSAEPAPKESKKAKKSSKKDTEEQPEAIEEEKPEVASSKVAAVEKTVQKESNSNNNSSKPTQQEKIEKALTESTAVSSSSQKKNSNSAQVVEEKKVPEEKVVAIVPARSQTNELPKTNETKAENASSKKVLEDKVEVSKVSKPTEKESAMQTNIPKNTELPVVASKETTTSKKFLEEKAEVAKVSKSTEKESALQTNIPKNVESPVFTSKETTSEIETEEEVSALEEENKIASDFNNYLKFRVGVRGGYGNIMNNPFGTDAFGLYQSKMLRGWTFGSDFSYFITDNIGLGIFYTNYQSKNKATNITATNQATGTVLENASISNKISHKYLGPIVYYRKHIDYKTLVILGLSGGKYFVSDNGIENGLNFKNTGNTYGAAATIGLDFLIGSDATGRDIIFSIEGGYNYGKLTQMNYGAGNVTLANPVDLSRLDLTVGLRFTRFPKYLRSN